MRKTFLTGRLSGTSVFRAEICAAEDAAQDSKICQVIRSLVAGFRAGDTEAAFRYVSPVLRGAFGRPLHFAQMVRQGYPMLWQPGELRFLGLRAPRGVPVQNLVLCDQRGAPWHLGFEMMRVKDEGWRINGVEIVQNPHARI
ncbi:MAG: DUF4864 domain-containing protein [Mangrovicoccus sp.]|nr:DUF4864 domain-containing protein [Mangrovicoccus sp.]